jgi:glycosyltransferase involved in cell wall biosynthesis
MIAPSAVGYFRMGLSNAVLRAKGHKVVELQRPDPDISEEELAKVAADHAELIETADLVHLLQPADCPFEERADCYKRMRGSLVLECDDDLFAFMDDQIAKDPVHLENMAESEKHGVQSIHRETTLKNFETWLRGVDLVTTTTEHLAQVFKAHGAREVAVCPNAVLHDFQRKRAHPDELALVRSPAALDLLARSARKPAHVQKTIGWTGSIAHKRDVAPALLALRKILSIDGNTRVVTLGPVNFRDAAEWKGFTPAKDQFFRFRTVVGKQASDTVPFAMPTENGSLVWTYYSALESFDATVAILPLLDTPFNRGKSDVTLLSWSIQGIPSVVSRNGPYALAEKAGLPAIYVDHHDVDAWTNAIRSLLYDRARARELGEKARAWVLEHRSFPKAVKPWEDAYQRAILLRGVYPDPDDGPTFLEAAT